MSTTAYCHDLHNGEKETEKKGMEMNENETILGS